MKRDPIRRSALRRALYARNREQERAKLRAYRAANPEKSKAWAKENYEKHKAARSASNKRRYDPYRQYVHRLQKQFGISPADYQRMCEQQRHCCAICSQPERGMSKRLTLDHDHVSGMPRSLLCSSCNKAIGFLGESPARARALAEYLEKHQCRSAA